jgi:acyl-phosphate glycerol 3-phosphate acyltransferase
VNAILLPTLAVLAAYLIGAIPFGFLTARWARGIDIRTVGSGNIGATNVGRTLGFRFFVVVFVFDLLKGFLPTYYFPKLVATATGQSQPTLGVLIALATILGHNFPVYLGFKGGKGVATSLGALFALDAVASASSAIGFVVFLLITRYVSLSSLLGAIVFAAAHFARVDHPFQRDQMAMSVLTVALLGLIFARHGKNLARIKAGTEPKVSLRKKRSSPSESRTVPERAERPRPPSGRVAWVVLPALALAGVAATIALNAARTEELWIGQARLTEVARVATGHQRAGRLAFADGGRLLAVTCPRYNRLVLYRVTGTETLEVARDIPLNGRPVAIAVWRERFLVLQRPIADAHHLEPAYWEEFNFAGDRVGSKFRVGWDPDDLAITPDGRYALVLLSGRAEGETNRPAPSLEVVEIGGNEPKVVGNLTFDRPGDDPDRLMLSISGGCAAVALLGTNQVASIDLVDRENPRLINWSRLPEAEIPYPSSTGGDAIVQPVPWLNEPGTFSMVRMPEDTIVMPVNSESEAVPMGLPSGRMALACTLPDGSGLALVDVVTRRELGRLPLHGGALQLTPIRPTAIAFAPERGLLAVSNRAGGVHLIAVRTAPEMMDAALSPARRVRR